MKSKMDRCAAQQPSRGAALLLAASACCRSPRSPPSTLGIVLDQATIMKLPEKVSTIVVGNPLIADVAVQSGGLVVVTGKGYGATNLIVLDRAGAVLMERSIVVRGPTSQTRCRSIAAWSARPIAARRTASAASRSAIPPPISRRPPASPTSATASRPRRRSQARRAERSQRWRSLTAIAATARSRMVSEA